jgi:uncharacterized membrane protein
MAIKLRYRSPSGETRPWTFRQVLQGFPLDMPTHPMFVHFPIAFYNGALAFDVLSRVGHFPWAPATATYLIVGALAGFAAAATTGIAERASMPPKLRVRRLATRHMLLQFIAAAVFAVNLGVRWSHRHAARSGVGWIVLDVIGIAVMTAASDIGGQMVFKIGYRGLGGGPED